jgi:altronate dehydratase
VRSVLVISDRDNVATALEPLEAGRRIDVRGAALGVLEPIPSGHKIALAPIASGDAVIKYGSPIGVASADIAAGAHVHTHNLSSSRGRGDLAVASPEPQPRLAEPPDDRNGTGAPAARASLRPAQGHAEEFEGRSPVDKAGQKHHG